MARTASGGEWLEQAQVWVWKAKTLEQLHEAQAVLLPLMGMTLAQTEKKEACVGGYSLRL